MSDEAVDVARASETPMRVDWRTGRPMVQHDESFWREHERLRVEQGRSIAQYCAAHGLALSTYRHRVYGKKRTGSPSARPPQAALERTDRRPQPPRGFVALTTTPVEIAPAPVEVTWQGMTLRLHGEAAERVLVEVVKRLA